MHQAWLMLAGLALLVGAPPSAAHKDHPPQGTAEAAPAGAPAAPAPRRRWGADYFPNVPLLTQDGKPVRFYDDLLKGKAVAINVVYTHCEDACPLETARLVQVQKLLGDRVGRDLHFYSISIDPQRDTPPVLKAYAEKFGVGPGWTFLTGKLDDIRQIAKRLGLSSLTDQADRDGHLPALMVGNEPTGEWMRLSAMDNPRFLATKLDSFLTGWQNHALRHAPPAKSYAAARPIEDLDPAAYLFRMRCAACHTIGGGDAIGPDLLGVTRRRERSWLTRFIAAPDAMLAAKDPIALELLARFQPARMPNLQLAEQEVDRLIGYLETQTASREAATSLAGSSDEHRRPAR